MKGLEKNCAACGKERKSTHLVYDPQTLKGYCHSPYVCNEDHPNSPVNLIRNQRESLLVDFRTANEAHKTQLLIKFDSGSVDRIRRMLMKPITVRVQDPDMAKFMVELQEDLGLDSASETIRYCIQAMQENRGVYYADHKKLTVEKNVQKAAQEAVDSFAPPTPAITVSKSKQKDDDEGMTF